MGRQRAMPLYKITRVCFRGRCNFSCFQSSFLLFPFLPFLSLFLVWSWTLRMCSTRDFLEVLVPFFRLFTSLSAIPEDSCWFWTVCGHRDHGRPWAGSGQCLSIKSRGVTPGGAMFLSVLEAVATFRASNLLFSYFLSFRSFPCSWSGPGPCGCVPRETSWKFLCHSSCSLRLFLPCLEVLAGS